MSEIDMEDVVIVNRCCAIQCNNNKEKKMEMLVEIELMGIKVLAIFIAKLTQSCPWIHREMIDTEARPFDWEPCTQCTQCKQSGLAVGSPQVDILEVAACWFKVALGQDPGKNMLSDVKKKVLRDMSAKNEKKEFELIIYDESSSLPKRKALEKRYLKMVDMTRKYSI